MGLRPAHCYRDIERDRAYTRVSRKDSSKNYIGTILPTKIRQFNMGNPLKQYTKVVDLCTKEAIIVRDNAIEAVRQSLHRRLQKKVGIENYFMRVRTYPFHILRENKQAQGAGADRVSQGMSHAFGKPIGRAVRLHRNEPIISVLTDSKYVETVKSIMESVKSKLPCKVKIVVHENVSSVGTLPRKTRIKTSETKESSEKEAAAKKESK